MRSFFFACVAMGSAAVAMVVACTGDDPAQCAGPACEPSDAATDTSQQGAIVVTVPKRPIVIQGSSTSLEIEVSRTSFNGPITIAVDGLPPNVSVTPATIAPDATKVSVTINATTAATQGESTITVSGSDATGSVKGNAQTQLLVRGPAGTLDTTFGNGGKATAAGGANGFLVAGAAVQSDGKVLVGGSIDEDFVVVRFNVNGTLDTGFGINGRATTDFRIDGGVTSDSASGMSLAPDGAIVMSGYTVQPYSKYAVARFLPNGKVDPAFDGDGYALFDYEANTNLTGDRFGHAVVVQIDGKPVIGGTILDNAEGHELVLARVTTQGALDPTFGTPSGFSTHPLGGGTDDECLAVALDPQGVVCGGHNGNRFVALRVLANGKKDPAFAGGFAFVDFGEVAKAQSVSVLADRSVLLSGPVGTKIGVAQITPAGLPGPSFGTAGKMTFDFGAASPTFGGAVVDATNRLLVLAATGTAHDLAIAAVKPDGTLDATFGTAGKLIIPIANNSDNFPHGPRIALAADGRFVVATKLTSGELVTLRYWN